LFSEDLLTHLLFRIDQNGELYSSARLATLPLCDPLQQRQLYCPTRPLSSFFHSLKSKMATSLKDPPVTSSTAAAAPDDSFVPRRSNRVSADLAQPDGDEWTERLAVCEGAGAKLLIRSYYKNSRTAARAWDEPPSGASKIRHATADMRKQAETQLQELQFTLDMIPPEEGAENASTSSDNNNNKKQQGKKGFLGRFRKKEKTKKKPDDSKDLNLQRAIARSMADQKGGHESDEPVVYYDPESSTNNLADDEALQMAKALSMSESSNPSGNGNVSSHMSEEEMFQRALEASTRDVPSSGVASLMSDHEDLLFQAADTPITSDTANTVSMQDPQHDLDQKMAAKPAATTTPTRPAERFDPYNAHSESSSHQPASASSMVGAKHVTAAAQESPSHFKMEADENDGKRKPGRSMARRVFGGKKAMEDKAGVV
jgi:hypothetical protein